MPFTPFHMGPGLAVKAPGGRRFSLMVFGFSQVAMDIEPLIRIVRGDAVLHGFTHTYVGATLIALVSLFAGRPTCRWLLNFWTPARISRPAAAAGAFVGAYSHVVLDSIMHADMRPLAPFSEANALLHLISVGSLHLACVFSGVLGALLFLARRAYYGAAGA